MRVRKYDLRVSDRRVPYLHSLGMTTITDDEPQNRPEMIADIVRRVYKADRLPEERVWMLAMDSCLQVVGLFEISHGTCDASILSPASVIQRGLLCGAKSICLCHNHPSGNLEPSSEDISITHKIREACAICGIDFVDHIIVSRRGYLSLRSEGII